MCTLSTSGNIAKRQKRLPGSSDSKRVARNTGRVTLDVGGEKFVSAASTLVTNSTYFASLLSDDWSESNDDDDDEIFIDQDPLAFGTLLAYMRRGMMKVEDVDTDVLALAEFLGVERLLLAVKVRWYFNIGRGPVFAEDGDVADAFDGEHGGIMNAMSAGLFPRFLERDDVHAEKEFAVVKVLTTDENDYARESMDMDFKAYSVDQGVNCDNPVLGIECDSFIGALNGVFANGYTVYEGQLERHCRTLLASELTFSRRKHSHIRYKMNGRATDIFIPTNNDSETMRDQYNTKQFVMLAQGSDFDDDTLNPDYKIFAPQDLKKDVRGWSHPYDSRTLEITENKAWLQEHNFVTEETSLGEVFATCLRLQTGFMRDIYSRTIPLLQR